MFKDWVPDYERRHVQLPDDVREKVVRISPAQVDRTLAEKKMGVSKTRPRTPKANAAIKRWCQCAPRVGMPAKRGWIEQTSSPTAAGT